MRSKSMAVVEPAEQRDLNDTSALIDEAGGAGSLRPFSMGEAEQIVREMPRDKARGRVLADSKEGFI